MASTKTASHDCPFANFVSPNFPDRNEPLEGRVGRLEGTMATIVSDLQEQNQAVQSLGREIGALRDLISDKIEGISSRVAASGKPNWQAVAAFVGVGIMIIGLAASLLTFIFAGQTGAINECKSAIAAISQQVFLDQRERGRNDAFVSEHAERINGLDEKLQVKLNEHDKMFEEMRSWRLRHAVDVAECIGDTKATLTALREDVRKFDERQYDHQVNKLSSYERLEVEARE